MKKQEKIKKKREKDSKKLLLIIIAILSICLIGVSVFAVTIYLKNKPSFNERHWLSNQVNTNNYDNFNQQSPNGEGGSLQGNVDSQSAQNENDASLKIPKFEWWDIYNIGFFNTAFTAVMYNDNDVAIDITYDIVYLKNGQEISRNIAYRNYSVPAKQKFVILGKNNIPKSNSVDEVRIDNVKIIKATRQPIAAHYNYLGVFDREAEFRFEFERTPMHAYVVFILYNDKNNNDVCDKGEIVMVETDDLEDRIDDVSFDTDEAHFDKYEVYYIAY